MKIALLIPSTSRGREWTSVRETYLYGYTMKTFGITRDKEHDYTFYIGIDRGDPIYDKTEVQDYLEKLAKILDTRIQFIYMDGITKGHLTVMWNRLFTKSYEDGNDYFFQCGDDISFETHGWVNACIAVLQSSNNIGMSGPINNNSRILTQSFVSRKHMEIFGYYFPEEIINWCCDDWINEVYIKINKFYPLNTHYCVNLGGPPRYDINNDSNFAIRNFKKSVEHLRKNASKIAIRDVEKLKPLL